MTFSKKTLLISFVIMIGILFAINTYSPVGITVFYNCDVATGWSRHGQTCSCLGTKVVTSNKLAVDGQNVTVCQGIGLVNRY